MSALPVFLTDETWRNFDYQWSPLFCLWQYFGSFHTMITPFLDRNFSYKFGSCLKKHLVHSVFFSFAIKRWSWSGEFIHPFAYYTGCFLNTTTLSFRRNRCAPGTCVKRSLRIRHHSNTSRKRLFQRQGSFWIFSGGIVLNWWVAHLGFRPLRSTAVVLSKL